MFVIAAYHHGAGVLKSCSHTLRYDTGSNPWSKRKDFKEVIKSNPKLKDMEVGDVILRSYIKPNGVRRSSHIMIYVGNGKIAHASSRGFGPGSIRVQKYSSIKNHSQLHIFRWVGKDGEENFKGEMSGDKEESTPVETRTRSKVKTDNDEKGLSEEVRTWITNKVAVSDLSEETTEVLFNGKLPEAQIIGESGEEYITGEGEFICPLKDPYYCNSYGQYNAGRSYENHPGLDMSISPSGTKIYASGAGTVVLSGMNGGYGYCCVIDHGNNLRTLYGHMMSAPIVKKATKVKKGQPIGYMGSTGNSSGPHLHFEVRKNSSTMDPAKLVPGLKHAIGRNVP